MSVAEAVATHLERLVHDGQARHPIPGVAIGILASGEETTAAFGVTNVEHPLPVTADTIFQIGSITKTFLGTLVMHLVEEGRLDLDAPVRKWIPGLRLRDEDAAKRVTLKHLLTHTAGWFGDHIIDVGGNDDALARYVASMEQLEQQVAVGSEWAYNNAAFGLAGRVVEVVTELPVEQAMRDLLIVPLGLKHTFFFPDEVITYRVAVGHNAFDREPRVARPWALPRASNCVGGIASTVTDLLAYARFHMGDGSTVGGDRYLSQSALAFMRSPLVRGPLGQSRGIAWAIEDVEGVRIIGHNGATFGQQALLQIAPDRGFAIAMLTNTNEAAQLQNAVARWAAERYLGVHRGVPQPRAFASEEAEPVVGTYRNTSNELRIALDEGGLVLHQLPLESSFRNLMHEPPPIPKPVELSFGAPGRLIVREGPLKDSQIELLRPEWIRFGGRLYRRVEAA